MTLLKPDAMPDITEAVPLLPIPRGVAAPLRVAFWPLPRVAYM
jgi:hypothetical protein